MTSPSPSRFDARTAALKVLRRIEREGAYSNLAIQSELERVPEAADPDRRLMYELVMGVLRRRRTLDAWLEHGSGRPLDSMAPGVVEILRLSAYQILFLDRVPDYAVFSEARRLLSAARLDKAASLVDALLHRLVREGRNEGTTVPPNLPADPVSRLGLLHSLPDWMVRLWTADYPDPAALSDRLAALNTRPPISLCVNPERGSADALSRRLAILGAESKPSAFFPAESLDLINSDAAGLSGVIQEGLAHVMDEAALAVGMMAAPAPGENVLDLCAAPGGKSLFLAGRVAPTGKVHSVDRAAGRLRLLERQAPRHGFPHISLQTADATQPIPGLPPAAFDLVLVDAPCSALGLLRRHPEIRWRRSPEDVAALADTAGRILRNARSYVRPGGRLVFSVCTLTPEEGIDQLERFRSECDWPLVTPTHLPAPFLRATPFGDVLDTRRMEGLDGFFAWRMDRPSE